MPYTATISKQLDYYKDSNSGSIVLVSTDGTEWLLTVDEWGSLVTSTSDNFLNLETGFFLLQEDGLYKIKLET